MTLENHKAAYEQVWHNAYATFQDYLKIVAPDLAMKNILSNLDNMND